MLQSPCELHEVLLGLATDFWLSRRLGPAHGPACLAARPSCAVLCAILAQTACFPPSPTQWIIINLSLKLSIYVPQNSFFGFSRQEPESPDARWLWWHLVSRTLTLWERLWHSRRRSSVPMPFLGCWLGLWRRLSTRSHILVFLLWLHIIFHFPLSQGTGGYS